MTKDWKYLNYNREKKVAITFDGVTRQFTLIALSAKDNAAAWSEAQQIYTETVKLMPGMADSIRTVCLLQNKDVLAEAVLEVEDGSILHKAALTLAEGEPDYEEKLQVKAEALKDARRAELKALAKEQLADKLVIAQVNWQLNTAWDYAVMEARIAKALYGDDGQRLFSSADRMKEALPAEVLARLCEAMAELLSERGDAQVFPEPHTSKG